MNRKLQNSLPSFNSRPYRFHSPDWRNQLDRGRARRKVKFYSPQLVSNNTSTNYHSRSSTNFFGSSKFHGEKILNTDFILEGVRRRKRKNLPPIAKRGRKKNKKRSRKKKRKKKKGEHENKCFSQRKKEPFLNTNMTRVKSFDIPTTVQKTRFLSFETAKRTFSKSCTDVEKFPPDEKSTLFYEEEDEDLKNESIFFRTIPVSILVYLIIPFLPLSTLFSNTRNTDRTHEKDTYLGIIPEDNNKSFFQSSSEDMNFNFFKNFLLYSSLLAKKRIEPVPFNRKKYGKELNWFQLISPTCHLRELELNIFGICDLSKPEKVSGISICELGFPQSSKIQMIETSEEELYLDIFQSSDLLHSPSSLSSRDLRRSYSNSFDPKYKPDFKVDSCIVSTNWFLKYTRMNKSMFESLFRGVCMVFSTNQSLSTFCELVSLGNVSGVTLQQGYDFCNNSGKYGSKSIILHPYELIRGKHKRNNIDPKLFLIGLKDTRCLHENMDRICDSLILQRRRIHGHEQQLKEFRMFFPIRLFEIRDVPSQLRDIRYAGFYQRLFLSECFTTSLQSLSVTIEYFRCKSEIIGKCLIFLSDHIPKFKALEILHLSWNHEKVKFNHSKQILKILDSSNLHKSLKCLRFGCVHDFSMAHNGKIGLIEIDEYDAFSKFEKLEFLDLSGSLIFTKPVLDKILSETQIPTLLGEHNSEWERERNNDFYIVRMMKNPLVNMFEYHDCLPFIQGWLTRFSSRARMAANGKDEATYFVVGSKMMVREDRWCLFPDPIKETSSEGKNKSFMKKRVKTWVM